MKKKQLLPPEVTKPKKRRDMEGPSEFSPFDPPVKDVKPGGNSGGVKMDPITDRELDGNVDEIKDAPEFVIPDLGDIPDVERPNGPRADPNAPGSGGDTFTGDPGTGSGNGQSSGGTKLDDGFRKEFTEYIAKWIIDMLFRLIIFGVRQYAKIDRSEIILAIDQGHINDKFLNYVDEVNNNVDRNIDVTQKEKDFIIEPLKYFIEVKKVEIGPGWMVAGSLLMVIVTLAIKAYQVKQENKRILDRIIKESAELRKAASQTRRPYTYHAPEEVKFSVAEETPENQEPTFTVEKDPVPPADEEIVVATVISEEPNDSM